MSSIEFSRRLGIIQTAAWKMKHKLAQVMLERNTRWLEARMEGLADCFEDLALRKP